MYICKFLGRTFYGAESEQERVVLEPRIDWIKTPLNKYTFKPPRIRNWVEDVIEGYTLNLFAGTEHLFSPDGRFTTVRNDVRENMPADYHMDALEFLMNWKGDKFDTILLDPPYRYRKSMEMYEGAVRSPFKAVKDVIVRQLNPKGIVVTFGYHSVSMGSGRGFEVERLAIFSHGGAIHDTIATVERMVKQPTILYLQ